MQLEKLQHRIDKLLHQLYGQKSEKKSESQTLEPGAKTHIRNQASISQCPKRQALPAHLRREKIIYELSESERVCTHCQQLCSVIGQEVTEQLDIIPTTLYVKQHIRYKYACRHGCEVKIASLPAQPIDKAIAGAGLLADVLVAKYQDAMPLYRQSLRFKRHGATIPDSTLCDWVAYCADRLQPIVLAMKSDLIRHSRLHTDDTPVPVLAKGKTKTGRLWTYVANSSSGCKMTVYDYTPTRSLAGPKQFLAGFKGFLQADAYGGYDCLYQSGDIIEVGCLAHARRKFFEITLTVKGESLANVAVDKIAAIYAVESKIRDYPSRLRYFYRKKYLKPLYRQLHHWLRQKQKNTLAKTPIHQAIQYALNHWRALQNVLADGQLEVDNNTAERAIKPLVIGRKNYLFAGSDEGGKRAAIIYSLIETCKQNDINTFDYLRDVLTRLPTHKANKISELLPYHWQSHTI